MLKKATGTAMLLALIPAYIVTVYAATPPATDDCGRQGAVPGEQVGVCTELSVDVIRGYYFDTIRLPVTRFGLNLDLLHRTFLPGILLLAGLLWKQ